MPLLTVPEGAGPDSCAHAAQWLRSEKLFYGMFYRLPDGAKLDTEAVRGLAQWTRLCILWAGGERAGEKALQKAVSAQRKAPDAPVFLMDWQSDSRALEKYISAGASVHWSDSGETLRR